MTDDEFKAKVKPRGLAALAIKLDPARDRFVAIDDTIDWTSAIRRDEGQMVLLTEPDPALVFLPDDPRDFPPLVKPIPVVRIPHEPRDVKVGDVYEDEHRQPLLPLRVRTYADGLSAIVGLDDGEPPKDWMGPLSVAIRPMGPSWGMLVLRAGSSTRLVGFSRFLDMAKVALPPSPRTDQFLFMTIVDSDGIVRGSRRLPMTREFAAVIHAEACQQERASCPHDLEAMMGRMVAATNAVSVERSAPFVYRLDGHSRTAATRG